MQHRWTLDVLRAAYEPGGDDGTWLQRILALLTPMAESDLGGLAHYFTTRGDCLCPWGFVTSGCTLAHINGFLTMCAEASPALRRRLQRFLYRYICLNEHGFLDFPEVARNLYAGVVDCTGLVITDGRKGGCGFWFPSSQNVVPPHAAQSHWQTIAAHLATALRLRRWGPGDLRTWHPLHAGLNRATRFEHWDRPKGDAVALPVWSEMLSGHWSVFAHFEQHGYRYVLARQEDPADTSGRLTAKERESVRYALSALDYTGIAGLMNSTASTVATHLGHAMKKLQVHCRAELMAVIPLEP